MTAHEWRSPAGIATGEVDKIGRPCRKSNNARDHLRSARYTNRWAPYLKQTQYRGCPASREFGVLLHSEPGIEPFHRRAVILGEKFEVQSSTDFFYDTAFLDCVLIGRVA
jgi:hypothetical protein